MGEDLRRLFLALKGLVRVNEEHNEAVQKIIGRPLAWKDVYLEEAREVLVSVGEKYRGILEI